MKSQNQTVRFGDFLSQRPVATDRCEIPALDSVHKLSEPERLSDSLDEIQEQLDVPDVFNVFESVSAEAVDSGGADSVEMAAHNMIDSRAVKNRSATQQPAGQTDIKRRRHLQARLHNFVYENEGK